MTREHLPCDRTELEQLFLFERLTDDQLDWLCRNGHVERFETGYVYREDDPATAFYVLLDGELVISRRMGDEDVEINRTSQVGAYAGAWRSVLGDRVNRTLDDTLRTTRPSRMYVLAADRLAQLMREWFPMPLHLLEGLFSGMRNTGEAIGQRERLMALGSLAAGLTHELNNPAAAAISATAALRERVGQVWRRLGTMPSGERTPDALATVANLREQAVTRMSPTLPVSPMAAAEREDELTDWLDVHGVPDGWDIAPTFVQAGLDVAWLDTVAAEVGDGARLDSALGWLNLTVDIEMLMGEIEDSTIRIFALVDAAKQYSQLDRAPYQVTDVHELLDSTLLVLNHRIGDGVTVVRQYDRSLPAIQVYAAELNQVWTNLIDNAVDAMNGRGTLTVRTSADGDRLLVEIRDTGPGVPDDIRHRIFEPFFTTKPVGSAVGLGLDASWRVVVDRHHGDLSVESSPGDTRFRVRLPYAQR
ncbi:MAG TPA: ATP-binding protein [Pseudonocardiaceae bacterium]|nr:ATP-binding protein [Pseudonocardiaceae bacterium]